MTSATVHSRVIRSARIAVAVAIAVVACGLVTFVTAVGGGRAGEAACSPAGFGYSSVEMTYLPPELICDGEWWAPGHEAGPVSIDRTGDLMIGLAAVAIINIVVVVGAVVAIGFLLRRPGRADEGGGRAERDLPGVAARRRSKTSPSFPPAPSGRSRA